MSETADQRRAAEKRKAAADAAAEVADTWREEEASRNEPPKDARSKRQTTRARS